MDTKLCPVCGHTINNHLRCGCLVAVETVDNHFCPCDMTPEDIEDCLSIKNKLNELISLLKKGDE